MKLTTTIAKNMYKTSIVIGTPATAGFFGARFYYADYTYNKTPMEHCSSLCHGIFVGTYAGLLGSVSLPIWAPLYLLYSNKDMYKQHDAMIGMFSE